ncbi:MAG: hypothetical protein GWP05_04805 [Anaerolineaceae bacterium]|nr:hypothetical protein [Anaerolineaceae bacterium]
MTSSRGWSIVALVIALALSSAGVWWLSASRADAQGGAAFVSGGSDGRFTMASGPLGEKKLGVFIIDAQTMRLLVYAIDSESRQLKLMAVRDISQDVRLSYWNNDKPLPEEIRKRLDSGSGRKQPGDAPLP